MLSTMQFKVKRLSSLLFIAANSAEWVACLMTAYYGVYCAEKWCNSPSKQLGVLILPVSNKRQVSLYIKLLSTFETGSIEIYDLSIFPLQHRNGLRMQSARTSEACR
uniref:Putative secreted protein n=1 Tax=Ixodes ricinus TaxID=34613 RepID=A0A6B0UHR6_IXORI